MDDAAPSVVNSGPAESEGSGQTRLPKISPLGAGGHFEIIFEIIFEIFFASSLKTCLFAELRFAFVELRFQL